jgi:hypothetical protein
MLNNPSLSSLKIKRTQRYKNNPMCTDETLAQFTIHELQYRETKKISPKSMHYLVSSKTDFGIKRYITSNL